MAFSGVHRQPVFDVSNIRIAMESLQVESVAADLVPATICRTDSFETVFAQNLKDCRIQIFDLAKRKCKIPDSVIDQVAHFLRRHNDFVHQDFAIMDLSKIEVPSRMTANLDTGVCHCPDRVDGVGLQRATDLHIVFEGTAGFGVTGRNEIGERNLTPNKHGNCERTVFGIPVIKCQAGGRNGIRPAADSSLCFFQ